MVYVAFDVEWRVTELAELAVPNTCMLRRRIVRVIEEQGLSEQIEAMQLVEPINICYIAWPSSGSRCITGYNNVLIRDSEC